MDWLLTFCGDFAVVDANINTGIHGGGFIFDQNFPSTNSFLPSPWPCWTPDTSAGGVGHQRRRRRTPAPAAPDSCQCVPDKIVSGTASRRRRRRRTLASMLLTNFCPARQTPDKIVSGTARRRRCRTVGPAPASTQVQLWLYVNYDYCWIAIFEEWSFFGDLNQYLANCLVKWQFSAKKGDFCRKMAIFGG